MLRLPSTRMGRWSLALAALFWLSFGVLGLLAGTGQRRGETFFSNPWLAAAGLAAGVSGVATGLVSALAILRRRERSLLVFLSLLPGLFVLFFLIGELIGHD